MKNGKLENLLNFEDFKDNWKAKEATKTKRTEVGLDIVAEKKTETENKEKNECPLRK